MQIITFLDEMSSFLYKQRIFVHGVNGIQYCLFDSYVLVKVIKNLHEYVSKPHN